MRFSARTEWDREETELGRAVRVRRAAGVPLPGLIDLTASNPTRCGFAVDGEAVLRPLLGAGSLGYAPEPLGLLRAREAVCGYYADHDAAVQPEQVCLTTSTSEAYSFLFRLLCDPGDEVLIASPSYPLFAYLAVLDDVRLVPYPLVYEHGWQTEPGRLRERVTERTRAIALVHPNNPTGHFVGDRELRELEELCAECGLALLVDEVFLDFGWGEEGRPGSFARGEHPALTFVLSGLSKVAGLPQMKLGWIAAFGPEAVRREALERLEVIGDTFLSVSAPAQEALPEWLAKRSGLQGQIRARVRANLRCLDEGLAGSAAGRLAGEGGWYAVVRVPAVEPDEVLALRLLEGKGVLVHPGSSFGFPGAGYVVVSLLPEEGVFRRGVEALVGEVRGYEGVGGAGS